MNIGEPWPGLDEAETRVLEIQTKLHQWATGDPKRRFDDLYNLVYDPAVLVMAWPGSGFGATGGRGRPESTEWHPAPSSPAQRTY